MSVVLWTALVTPILWAIYKLVSFVFDVRRRSDGIKTFPLPQPFHWLMGNLLFDPTRERSEELLGVIRSWNVKYPRGVNQFWVSIMEPAIYLRHPDTVKQILKSSEPKTWGYKMAEPWLGDGLLISKGNKWARNRRLLTPAFHFDILKPYVAIYNDSCDTLIKKMDGYAERNEIFDFYANSCLATLDVMLRCAMSYENDAQIRGGGHPYVKAVIELGELWNRRIFEMHPLFQIDFLYYLHPKGKQFQKHCDFVHAISKEIITKRRNSIAKKGENAFKAGRRYLDFLDILITAKDEDGTGLSDKDIQAEVDTFLFEGHDTTASALAWTFYMLAKHPEHQQKCQDEIDQILDGRENNYVEWNDFSKFKYTTMCLKESMRLNTTVPWIQRCLTKPIEIDGVMVEEGTFVQLDLYALHNHQDVWEEPNEYRPERFLDTTKMDPYAYVPFSAGPRNCIGQNFALQELKVTLARVLRRFHLDVASDKPAKRQINLVMRALGGLPVKLTPRNV